MRNIITVLREERGLSIEETALGMNMNLEDYKAYEDSRAITSKKMKAEIINFLIREHQ